MPPQFNLSKAAGRIRQQWVDIAGRTAAADRRPTGNGGRNEFAAGTKPVGDCGKLVPMIDEAAAQGAISGRLCDRLSGAGTRLCRAALICERRNLDLYPKEMCLQQERQSLATN